MSMRASHQLRTTVLLAILLVAGRVHAAALVRPSGCNCSSVPLTVTPWCGADGEWYQNSCIGFCANVAPGKKNQCNGATMPFTDYAPGPTGAESSAGPGSITSDVINAFVAEGLRYRGRIRLAKTFAAVPTFNSTAAQKSTPKASAGFYEVPTLRCTKEGDVYAGKMKVPVRMGFTDAAAPSLLNLPPEWIKLLGNSAFKPGSTGQLPALTPAPAAGTALPSFNISQPITSLLRLGQAVLDSMLGRKQQPQVKAAAASTPSPSPKPKQQPAVDLSQVESFARFNSTARRLRFTPNTRSLQEIIGSDQRRICPARSFPYSAIGQIQVTDSSGMYICSGALIRPDKVLTAAHCVWNIARNAFYQNLNFAPGRFNDDGQVVNPWGVVPWSSVTILDSFKKNPATWDVAVVTLQRPLGSSAGYLGMAAGCSSNTQLTVAGYPDDKSQGTCASSSCWKSYIDCNNPTNTHSCDTVAGMSGSPLWDSRNRIRMVHVAGVQGQSENRATTLTDYLVNAISSW